MNQDPIIIEGDKEAEGKRLKELLEKRKSLNTQVKELEEEINSLKETISEGISHEKFVVQGVRFRRIGGRNSYDYKRMIEEGMNLDPYLKVGKSYLMVDVLS